MSVVVVMPVRVAALVVAVVSRVIVVVRCVLGVAHRGPGPQLGGSERIQPIKTFTPANMLQ